MLDSANIQAASDGSEKNQFGTVILVISINEQKIIYSQLPIDGKHPDSHRAEAYALISMLTFIKLISSLINNQQKLKVYIDCKSLQKLTSNDVPTPENIDKKHCFLQLRTRHLVEEKKTTIIFVKSHHYRHRTDLKFEENLNQLVDAKATTYYENWHPSMIPLPTDLVLEYELLYLRSDREFFMRVFMTKLEL